MKRILIIEDDAALSRELATLLKNAGYDPVQPRDLAHIEAEMRQIPADLILLDINLPGINGEELLYRFRKSHNTPVFMLTSRTSEMDEILSMSYGADDYITKPYNPTILLLRIGQLFRRMEEGIGHLHYHDHVVSVSKGTIGDLILTKNEMIIFEQLLLQQGRIVTRDTLMTALWDHEEYIGDNALTVNISRLRTKLASLGYPEAIETRKKQGYVLQ